MTAATLDLAMKAAMVDPMAPQLNAAAEGEAGCEAFGNLLEQLVGEGGKRQPAPAEESGVIAEDSVDAPVVTGNALSLPLPQLQAALAAALSDVLTGCRPAATPASGPADDQNEGEALSRLIARSVKDVLPQTDATVSKADAVDMPGAAGQSLSAWLNGPHAVAAPVTGAQHQKPMGLTVLGVATHFAPVSGNAGVRAESTTAVSVASVLARPDDGDVDVESEPAIGDDVDERAADGVADIGTSDRAAPLVVSAPAQERRGDNQAPERRNPGPTGREAVPEAPTVSLDTNLAVEAAGEAPSAALQFIPAARQIGAEVVRALEGEAHRPAPAVVAEAKPAPLSKLKVLHIQLQPENLGTVTVRLELKSDAIDLRIEAARAETADLIQRDRETLSSLIRSAGYNTDEATIRIARSDATTAVTAAAAPDSSSGGPGDGSQASGNRSSHQREGGGERQGDQQRQPGQGSGRQERRPVRDGREVYV
jgi:chemotaxis protein MotD